MVYNPHPPYDILQNKLIDFATLQRLRRFARYWDMVGNSGNFVESTPLIGSENASPVGRASSRAEIGFQDRLAGSLAPPRAFAAFLRFSDWLHGRTHRTDSIALVRLMELLFEFLTGELKLDAKSVAETLWRDYQRGGRHDKPSFLKDFLLVEEKVVPLRKTKTTLPKRQARHLV
jgi:hypothetical protein